MISVSHITRRGTLIGLLTVALAQPVAAQTPNLTGSYRAEGRNPNGSAYSGTVVIGQQGNAVQINWTISNETYVGSGILDGRVLVVNWGQPLPVVYVVMPSGDLHGTWNDGTALERLIRQ
ncbi:hypothetical protein [Sulfitobacter aestuariivivens]|uniref:Fibronectin-binding protein n=1 Tax=Sulfitobacter aestuariivivens TaxID=2766981 RepID=A0A927D5R3_9RHOB|nr:hypothetical protein [Sulfitobacter aestuariivivens]MBD3663962.1 hypothetical protein [Sulfitobacter aestuariivivens]